MRKLALLLALFFAAATPSLAFAAKASSPSQDHDGRTRRPKCRYLAPHSRFLLGQITPRLSDDHITRSYWPRDFSADARVAFRKQRMKIGNYDTIVFGRRVFAWRLRWLGGG